MDPVSATSGTPSDIANLVVGNADLLDERKRDRLYPRKVPARLTAWDVATNRYSWVEQTWDKNGNRIDKPNGLAGSPTYLPAVAYGDGTIVRHFPQPVLLTPRIEATDTATGKPLGWVFEFPAYCACVAGVGSGSGIAGGDTVLTACCPVPVPKKLRAFWVVTNGVACPCWDGRELPIGPGGGWFWAETSCTGSPAVTFSIVCFGGFGGGYSYNFVTGQGKHCLCPSYPLPVGFPGGPGLAFTVASCDPFYAYWSSFTSADCPGATIDLVIVPDV